MHLFLLGLIQINFASNKLRKMNQVWSFPHLNLNKLF